MRYRFPPDAMNPLPATSTVASPLARINDPSNPIADGQGLVRQPEVSVSDQMVQMRLATLEVKANVRTIEAARDIYESVLQIGRS